MTLIILIPCFYSRLVRLKAIHLHDYILFSSVFLFQIGTIKSTAYPKEEVLEWMFLFQIGTIKSLDENAVIKIDIREFLFQIGTIKRIVEYDSGNKKDVSIPDWYD